MVNDIIDTKGIYIGYLTVTFILIGSRAESKRRMEREEQEESGESGG